MSEADEFYAWQEMIGRDLDPDIAAMPVLRYTGFGSERMLLQVCRHLKALRGMTEHSSNYREGDK